MLFNSSTFLPQRLRDAVSHLNSRTNRLCENARSGSTTLLVHGAIMVPLMRHVGLDGLYLERILSAFSPMRSPIFLASALSSSEMSSQLALGVSSLQ